MGETRDDNHPAAPVVAGIDGSETAVQAVLWAVDEAVSRDVPLRLVYVTKATHPSAEDYESDVQHGKASLRTAQAAVEAGGCPVKVETAIVTGPPGAALIAESDDAGLVCVGSVGIGRYVRSILGSTATDLAEKAHCPVAVIRTHTDDKSSREINWIVVGVNDEPDNSNVVEHALREAKLRDAPVLAIGEHKTHLGSGEGLDAAVTKWRQCHPDVHIYPVADQADVAYFLKHFDQRVGLAVIGGAQSGQLAEIVGPAGHPWFHHSECSVLVVRP
ncbi:universal stress protein [Mycolicibacterium hippocampi]|uniref:universal stress protein n=1 Tax=Mycolicibacterium hippocampi TaxID=659824 RepID=UPI003514A1AC